MQRRELVEQSNIAQSYSATISHEMKTPMETITFFIELIIAALKKGHFDKKVVSEMLKYNNLMLS